MAVEGGGEGKELGGREEGGAAVGERYSVERIADIIKKGLCDGEGIRGGVEKI